ncbi:MAG: hypothetical protein VX474_03860 [Pseudomonadota bacterium]|nr:hypothetical protein [Pseudomonadota bacterium]
MLSGGRAFLLSCFLIAFLVLAFAAPWLLKDRLQSGVLLNFDMRFQNSLARDISSSEYLISLPIGFTLESSGQSVLKDEERVIAAIQFGTVPAHAGRTVSMAGRVSNLTENSPITDFDGCPEALMDECTSEEYEDIESHRDVAVSSELLEDLRQYYQLMKEEGLGGYEYRLMLAFDATERIYKPELVLFSRQSGGVWQSSKTGQWLPLRIFQNLDIRTSNLRFFEGYGLEIVDIKVNAEFAE